MLRDPLEKMMLVGVRADDEGKEEIKRKKKKCVMVAVSAVVPAVLCSRDPATVSVREFQQQAFSGFQATHF